MLTGGFSFSPRSSSGSSGNSQAQGAKAAARAVQTEVEAVRGEIERLLMITEALWTFLKEEHGYSDEDLIKKIAEIDIQDGKLDGRVAKTGEGPKMCAACGRPAGHGRAVCLYCGEPIVRQPFER